MPETPVEHSKCNNCGGHMSRTKIRLPPPPPPKTEKTMKKVTEPPLPDPEKNTLQDRLEHLADTYDFFTLHLRRMTATEGPYQKLFHNLDRCIDSLIYALNDCHDIHEYVMQYPGNPKVKSDSYLPPTATTWNVMYWLLHLLCIFQRGAKMRDAVYVKKGMTVKARDGPKMKIFGDMWDKVVDGKPLTEVEREEVTKIGERLSGKKPAEDKTASSKDTEAGKVKKGGGTNQKQQKISGAVTIPILNESIDMTDNIFTKYIADNATRPDYLSLLFGLPGDKKLRLVPSEGAKPYPPGCKCVVCTTSKSVVDDINKTPLEIRHKSDLLKDIAAELQKTACASHGHNFNPMCKACMEMKDKTGNDKTGSK